MRLTLAIVLSGIVGLLGLPALAQDLPGIGTVVRDNATVGARVVPLLPGDWTVAAVGEKHGGDVPVGRVILVQQTDGKLNRWVYLSTNLTWNSGGGWKRDKEICGRNNVHYSYSDDHNNVQDAECWVLNHRGQTLGNNAGQAWIDFFRWSDSRGRPNTSLALEYFFARKGDFLTVQYNFNPVLAGFPDTPTAVWRGNPWHVDIASKDAKKLEYLRGLKAIGEEQFAKLRTVLR
jgi:hypothetical protein